MPEKYRGVVEKHGRFYARFHYEKKPYSPGKSYKSKAEAYRWIREKKLELENGINIVNPKITVKEYLKIYLKD